MKRCILSVVGKDRVGITAGVCGVLADAEVNILDINQTILQSYFTMVVLVDIDTSSLEFGEIGSRTTEERAGWRSISSARRSSTPCTGSRWPA